MKCHWLIGFLSIIFGRLQIASWLHRRFHGDQLLYLNNFDLLKHQTKNASLADLPKSILKRKRSIEVTSDSYLSNDSLSYKESANGKEIDDDESINEDGYDEQSPDGKRKKKARTTFTGRQIFELEKQFEVKKYLSSSERSEMAKLLNVTETQVSELM